MGNLNELFEHSLRHTYEAFGSGLDSRDNVNSLFHTKIFDPPKFNFNFPGREYMYNFYNGLNNNYTNQNDYSKYSLSDLVANSTYEDFRKTGIISPDKTIEEFKRDYNKINDTANKFSGLAKKGLSTGIQAISLIGADKVTDKLFDDSDLGRSLGTLFSSGVSSASNTITDNILKGLALTEGLGKNVTSSLAGAGAGLAGNLIGKGIDSMGGHSMLSRGIGQGVATGIGTVGGTVLSNLAKYGNVAGKVLDGKGNLVTGKLFGKGLGSINPYGFGMTVAGTALGAALGPSKEYEGEYGNITKTLDTVYDGITAVSSIIPGGQVFSGALTLNKGLSNLFGSTSGMTKNDAWLGSAFMPAPLKWMNVLSGHTTSKFRNLSWLNLEKANTFMLNGFGDLGDKFDKARKESGKTYGGGVFGLFNSNNAYKKAQANIDFSNNAWNTVLAMADLNELLNIRSQIMSSINNLRYGQLIQGGFTPLAIGKQGMKIFNNATNHNIGMRLLSAAALIDDKQTILSAQGGIKIRTPRMRAHRKGDLSRGLTEEELQLLNDYDALRREENAQRAAQRTKAKEDAAEKFNQLTSLVLDAMNLQANETPFTGLEYQQAVETLVLDKIDNSHIYDIGLATEAALTADLGVNLAYPLLKRGFRWVFNKAGLLVKVPKMAYSAEVKSPYYKIGQDGNLTFDTQNVISQIKSGKQDFINEMLSPEYAEAAIGNMEEAGKMGLSYTPVFEKAAFKSLREDGIIPKFIQDPKHTWHARTGFMGGTPGKATEIEYNISHPANIRYSTSHESGHVSRWGMGESESELLYMKHKANQIFKDDGDVGVYEFGSLTGEGATNMRDLGKDMGITLRTPYPGYEKALEMLQNAEKTSNKGGIVKVLKLTKDAMPHIWRALQGLHFEYIIPTALTATTLYNTNK